MTREQQVAAELTGVVERTLMSAAANDLHTAVERLPEDPAVVRLTHQAVPIVITVAPAA